MQQIYRRTLWHRCSSVNLLHIFRTPFSKNTYGWLLLTVVSNNLIKRCDQKIRQGKNQRIKHQIRKKNLSNQACEVSVLFCFCFFSNDYSVLYLESYKSRTHYSITVKFSTVQRKWTLIKMLSAFFLIIHRSLVIKHFLRTWISRKTKFLSEITSFLPVKLNTQIIYFQIRRISFTFRDSAEYQF